MLDKKFFATMMICSLSSLAGLRSRAEYLHIVSLGVETLANATSAMRRDDTRYTVMVDDRVKIAASVVRMKEMRRKTTDAIVLLMKEGVQQRSWTMQMLEARAHDNTLP